METDVFHYFAEAAQRRGIRGALLRWWMATDGYKDAEKRYHVIQAAREPAAASCLDHLLSNVLGVSKCAKELDAYNVLSDNAICTDDIQLIPCEGDRVASGLSGDRLFVQALVACVEENFWDALDRGCDAQQSAEYALVSTLGVLSAADGMAHDALHCP